MTILAYQGKGLCRCTLDFAVPLHHISLLHVVELVSYIHV